MTKYEIVKGQPDWQKPINDYMADNVITDTGWQSDGLTALNGFSFGKDQNGTYRQVYYRKMQLGTGRTVYEISGAIITPAITGPSNNITCLKFPAGFLPQADSNLFLGQTFVYSTGTYFNFINADDTTLSVTLHGTSVAAGSVLYPNIVYIV